MAYTDENSFYMLMVLGESFQNFTAAAVLYAERCPERHYYSWKTLQNSNRSGLRNWECHFDHSKGMEILRPVRNKKCAYVLVDARKNPYNSTRSIVADYRLSHMRF